MTDVVPKASWCAAYANEEFICITTYSGYRSSRRDPQGAQHHLRPEASDEELGLAVIDALKHSRFILPKDDPDLYDYRRAGERYKAWIADLMSRYGYETKRALFKNMDYCHVKSSKGFMTIRPSFHERLEGWSGDGISPDDNVVLSSDSVPEEIGAGLRLCFSRCIPMKR